MGYHNGNGSLHSGPLNIIGVNWHVAYSWLFGSRYLLFHPWNGSTNHVWCSIIVFIPGGGNGNPLQYSCLENAMDRGGWQATVHRVAKSWIRRKQFSSSSIVFVVEKYLHISGPTHFKLTLWRVSCTSVQTHTMHNTKSEPSK